MSALRLNNIDYSSGKIVVIKVAEYIRLNKLEPGTDENIKKAVSDGVKRNWVIRKQRLAAQKELSTTEN